MNKKIWKALGIAVCMLALAAPRAMAKTYKVGKDAPFIKFWDAVQEINDKFSDEKNEIVLMQDITLGGNPNEYTLYTLSRGETTIKGGGNKITISNAGITVAKKGTVLNLGANGYDGTLTIDGKTSGGFVSVLEGATANMYENVTLQNWQSVGNACVVIMGSDPVTGSNSVFNMDGGVIENCSRAVTAGSKATFNMSGGEIRNCGGGRGSGNGGGVRVYEATFVMSDGTISGCSADNGGGLCAENSSTVTITGGTISGCSAYAGGGLCAENFSTIEISGGTISGCTTSEAGMGGGLYAYKSTITISRGTIENNKATYGGGVALSDSTINPITNWTVIGNEAYKTKRGNGGIGGGIYLESRSMNVSAGSNRIYNNQAEGHGADICLEKGASITLPDAAGMGATYRDSGINIDGWYNDKPPYTPSESGQAVKELQLSGRQSLVASYKAIPVRIEIDANGGKGGSVSQTVHKGTNVILEAPTKEGYLFKGWKDEKGNSYPADADGKVKITVNKDMKLKAVWEVKSFTVTYVLLDGKTRTETAAYGENVTLVEEPRTGYTFVGWKDGEKMRQAGETITVTGNVTLTAEWKKLPSAENLPKTGDESPVLLWGAALAVSAAACFMLRRRK